MSYRKIFSAAIVIAIFIFANDSVAQKTTIAVLSFEVIGEIEDADHYRHGLPLAVSNSLSKISSLQVVERSNLNKVLDELNLSQTGMVDENEVQRVGKMLGAKLILMGSVQKIGNEIRAMARGVNVATSKIDFSVECKASVNNSRDLFELEDMLAQKISSNLVFVGPSNPEFEFHALYEDEKGKMQILQEGKVLHAGDEYALYVKPNDLCHLYVFQIDGSGKTYRLFPNETYKTAENPVRPGMRYWIPNTEKNFFLDETSGKEHIYVFASPNRIQNFEGESTVHFDLGDGKLDTMGPGGVKDKDNVMGMEAVINLIQKNGGVVHNTWFWHR